MIYIHPFKTQQEFELYASTHELDKDILYCVEGETTYEKLVREMQEEIDRLKKIIEEMKYAN